MTPAPAPSRAASTRLAGLRTAAALVYGLRGRGRAREGVLPARGPARHPPASRWPGAIYDTLTVPNPARRFRPVPGRVALPRRRLHRLDDQAPRGIAFHDGTRSAPRWSRTTSTRTVASTPAGSPSCSRPSSTRSTASRRSIAERPSRGHHQDAVGGVPGFLYGSGRLGIMAQAQLEDQEDERQKPHRHRPVPARGQERPGESSLARKKPDYWQTRPTATPTRTPTPSPSVQSRRAQQRINALDSTTRST